jgi:outer membrane putative beta-barrel porin/alpha-amylase
VLRNPKFNRLELAPIAPVLSSTVASTYPVASASSAVTYVFNPELDAPERQAGVPGPIIGERARTIGRGQFNIGLSYSYVDLTTINGDDLGALVNRPRVNGRVIIFPVKGGVTLRDGRFTNFLPVRVEADLGVQAHILAPSLTYGVTPDLDVNVTLPLLHTTLDVTAHTQVPDPRFPHFALPPGNPSAQRGSRSLADDASGVGDLLLRAKYVMLRSRWVYMATQLGLSVPTGSRDDLQGTGTTRVQPTLILSHVFANRVEPLLNVGVDCNADNVGQSVVRWAVGATVELASPLAASLVFLGHELALQGERIATPFFFQLERNDQYDASAGLRWRFADSGSVGLNVIVPLNDAGLRADAIPTFEAEYAF